MSPLSILSGSAELLADYPAAEHYRRDLLDAYEKVYGRDSINSAFGMKYLARVLIKLGHVDEAEQLYQRVVTAREKMTRASGVHSFHARHIQNSARIALARTQWKRAFREFRKSFRQLASDAGSQPTSNDYLSGSRQRDERDKFSRTGARSVASQPTSRREIRGAFRRDIQDCSAQMVDGCGGCPDESGAKRRRRYLPGQRLPSNPRKSICRRLRAEQENNMHSWGSLSGTRIPSTTSC